MAKTEAEVVNLPPAPTLKDKAATEVAARAAGVVALLEAIAADTAATSKNAVKTIDEFEKVALEAIGQAKLALEMVRQCNDAMQEYARTGTHAIAEQAAGLARLVNARVRE